MTGLPVLKGASVKLRPRVEADIDARLALGRDAEIAEMFGVSRQDNSPLTREEVLGWFQALCDHPYAWVIESGEAFIGSIRLDRVDLQDRRASLAVGIFDPASLGRGLGSEAIRLVLRHAFGTMGLHRIGIRVLAYNRRAIRAYEKCGFVIEGRERETAFVNGAWHDDIMMGLLEHEFQASEA
jgi:RimJ/RimL family protein N-acetyltransferase